MYYSIFDSSIMNIYDLGGYSKVSGVSSQEFRFWGEGEDFVYIEQKSKLLNIMDYYFWIVTLDYKVLKCKNQVSL